MSCTNTPCGGAPVNSAENELLPSQIENFTNQFFGTVTKTMVNGVVEWVLPCGLDVGLPNNPRADDEGLACYFLRLFDEGIVGLTGPQGATGASGTNGRNAFTITVASFAQPDLNAPIISVQTLYNPAILAGLNVFIQNSGWYQVDTVDPSGVLYLTLTKALAGVSGTVAAGKLVIPAGYPGESIVGPQGAQGPQGNTGPQGNSWTSTNYMYANVGGGVDFPLPAASAKVDFTNSFASVTLVDVGTYMLTACIGINILTGADEANVFEFKLVKTDGGSSDVSGSVKTLGGTGMVKPAAVNGHAQVVINVLLTTTQVNTTVDIFGSCDETLKGSVKWDETTLTYVRIG